LSLSELLSQGAILKFFEGQHAKEIGVLHQFFLHYALSEQIFPVNVLSEKYNIDEFRPYEENSVF
jgi:hypothetical protein